MLKVFVDTNVLVYSVDSSCPSKQRAARAVLSLMQTECAGVLSTQVMQEFYVATTRRLGIAPLTAKAMLHTFEALEVVVTDEGLIKEAIDCSIISQLSFWDALIVVSAEKARCGVLWTEDLNSGQIIRGVRVENPFTNVSGDTNNTFVRENTERYTTKSDKQTKRKRHTPTG